MFTRIIYGGSLIVPPGFVPTSISVVLVEIELEVLLVEIEELVELVEILVLVD